MSWVLGILGGIGFAMAFEDFRGFLIGAVLGVVCAQTLFLRERTRQLQEQLDALRRSSVAEPAAAQPLVERATSTIPSAPSATPAQGRPPVASKPAAAPPTRPIPTLRPFRAS